MSDDAAATIFSIIAVLVFLFGMWIANMLWVKNHYVLSEWEWKCNDWQIINDKPECKQYIPKEK